VTEYAVTIVLKQVEVSAATPAEALEKASAQVAANLGANTTSAGVAKLDRITVPGFNGTKR